MSFESDKGRVCPAAAESETEAISKSTKEAMAHYNHSFPAEGIPGIWLNVFEKLDKADKPAFSRTCDQWHDWVAPYRSTFLSKEFAPSLVESLPKKAFLQSRELCRSWTMEMDHQSAIHPTYHRFDFEIGAKHRCDETSKPHIRFSSAQEIQKFMKEMESHTGNPFPRRAIELGWNPPRQGLAINEIQLAELYRTFWLSAIQLFETFGEHIWDATFEFNDSDPDIIDLNLVEIIRNCFLLLPHLKRVHILGDISSSPEVTRNFYALNPLPQLEQLKTVIINSDDDFIDEVLSSCCVAVNITRLCIRSTSGPALCQQAYNFVNLEVLEAELLMEDLEGFRNLAHIPPLREIFLSFDDIDSVYAPRVFNALQTFSNSLVNFTLFDTLVVRDEDRTGTIINLPNLKRLDVLEWEGSLDPIIQISTLDILKIFSSSIPISQRDGNQLEFYGFEKRIYKSNIWNLMPSLNTFYVEDKFHHRYYFNKRQLTAQYESGRVNNSNGTVDAYTQTNDNVDNDTDDSEDDDHGDTDIEDDDNSDTDSENDDDGDTDTDSNDNAVDTDIEDSESGTD